MADRDKATFDLSRSEARVVIAALADEQMTASGDREMQLRNVQDHLAAEFDFDEYRGVDKGEMATEDDEGWIDNDIVFDDDDPDDTEEIELARVEADAVTGALADFELDQSHHDVGEAQVNAGVADDVRERIESAFGDR